jgi:hypothetical protein
LQELLATGTAVQPLFLHVTFAASAVPVPHSQYKQLPTLSLTQKYQSFCEAMTSVDMHKSGKPTVERDSRHRDVIKNFRQLTRQVTAAVKA